MENPAIQRVFKKIENQQIKGLEKYGTEVEVDLYSLKGWTQHSQQESMDKIVYDEMVLEKIEKLEKSMKAMYADTVDKWDLSLMVNDEASARLLSDRASTIFQIGLMIGFDVTKDENEGEKA
ncbi:hypothetical protein ACTHQC_07345 [Bacillus paralicheniformis]|uniref:hypothetical protein n=1 Tax=Bacillus paralicheniformis TaxID=1648923 RepID=UPI003F7C8D94